MTIREAQQLLPEILIDYLHMVGRDADRQERIAAARRLIEKFSPGTLKREANNER